MSDEKILKTCTAKYGAFTYPAQDMYIGASLELYGQYCEDEVNMFRSFLRVGDVVVDAGANIGALTVPISQIVGPTGIVYAVEPQPFLAGVLAKNLLDNECFNTRALGFGLGSKPGQIQVPNLHYGRKNNFGGISFTDARDRYRPQSGVISVPVSRLDDVLDVGRLRLIKADVEGMEMDLLLGAVESIKAFQPILYLECNEPEQTDEYLSFLEPLGYHTYWHISRYFDPDNMRGDPTDHFGNVLGVNILCAPINLKIVGMQPVAGAASHPKARR